MRFGQGKTALETTIRPGGDKDGVGGLGFHPREVIIVTMPLRVLGILALSLLLVACGSYYGSVGPLIGYSPGRGMCTGIELGSGRFTDKGPWENQGEALAAKLVRASAGFLSRPAGAEQPAQRVIHLTWDPRLMAYGKGALEGLPVLAGASLGGAYALGDGYSPVLGLSTSLLEPIAGKYQYSDGHHFPGSAHVTWLGLTFGWRYLAGGSLWYVQMVYMLTRSGTWRGLD